MEKKTTRRRNPNPTYDGTDRLTAEGRSELKNSDYGIPGKRKYPMPDAEHVHAAESYFRFASDSEKPALAHNIMQKAKEFGVDVESDTIKEWAAKHK